MSELVLTRTPGGALAPADGPTAEYISKMKLGAGLRGEFKRARDLTKHRRMWALFNFAFDQWDAPALEYEGQPVAKSLDRFRRDLIILAGHYTSTVNLRGEVRLEAKSIAFANMAQDEFDLLYRAILNVVWDRIFKAKGYASPDAVNEIVDELLRFE
jgi:hypothetical protein